MLFTWWGLPDVWWGSPLASFSTGYELQVKVFQVNTPSLIRRKSFNFNGIHLEPEDSSGVSINRESSGSFGSQDLGVWTFAEPNNIKRSQKPFPHQNSRTAWEPNDRTANKVEASCWLDVSPYNLVK